MINDHTRFLVASASSPVEAKDWAVHLKSEAAASDLAARHHLENLGEVLPGSSIYHLVAKHNV